MDITQERLKTAIENSGLSYREIEEKTDISHTSIYRYVHKSINKIPLSAVEKIAKATNTDIKWLMGWDDEPQEDSKLNSQLATLLSSMSDEEVEKTIEYIKFIQSQRK